MQTSKVEDDGRDKLILTAKRIVIDLVRVIEGATINEVRATTAPAPTAYLEFVIDSELTRWPFFLRILQVLKVELTPEHESQYKAVVKTREMASHRFQ
jgi:hypothetical protein